MTIELMEERVRRLERMIYAYGYSALRAESRTIRDVNEARKFVKNRLIPFLLDNRWSEVAFAGDLWRQFLIPYPPDTELEIVFPVNSPLFDENMSYINKALGQLEP